ncbi:UNVERIFIED_CONTAM: hypothetical protein HDU68_005473 [Siphonaria sp. JEL0065]|nr:hypothetical protein HDU68_005473 [Siphonaria sp. JEL0065]
MKFVHEPTTSGKLTVALHTEIYYELHGPPMAPKKLIFLNGSGQSCRMWGLALDHLKRRGDVEICVFDGRGVGDSQANAMSFTIEDLATDTIMLLQHLKWNSCASNNNVWIVGYSMGGMVAQSVILKSLKGTFKRAILINTTAKQSGLIPIKTTPDIIAFMFKMCFPESWLKQKPEESGLNEYATNREFIEKYTLERSATKTRQTAEGRKAQKTAVWGLEGLTVNQLNEIGQKTSIVVMCGRQDKTIRASNSDYLADKTGGRLIEFHQCGHALFEQEFTRFHALLDEMLA